MFTIKSYDNREALTSDAGEVSIKCVRVFIRTTSGRKPPVQKVKEFFKAEAVLFISAIGDGVFTAIINYKDGVK